MTRASFLAAVALFLALPLHAITLDDVRRSLGELRGASAITVRIDTNDRRTEGKKNTNTTQMLVVAQDGAGVRLVRATPPKANKKDEETAVGKAKELMNFAPELLKWLEGATLKRVSASSFEGNAATLLEIVPQREKSDNSRFVKSFADVLLLWLGPDGRPLAAERTQALEARVLLIGFKVRSKETLRFAAAGDRLLATKQVLDIASSGLNKDQSGVKTTTVTVQP
ncbi:MAG TPA: hypothetical protein VF618_25335 [Thermoanaerobaculia bacterium]